MTEMHQHLDDGEHDELDRELDMALAKYAAVEPRAGLEDRVLANVRAERSRIPDRVWWRWSVAGALAAVVVVALTLAWRSGRPSPPVVENYPAPTIPSAPKPATQMPSNGGVKQILGSQAESRERATLRRPVIRRAQPEAHASANPKLDQFPSPQPLSEQEKLLAKYIEQYPERAVLLARERTEQLRRDQLEEMGALPSGDLPSDSDERNHDTTER
jgi:hypothetical protein